MNKKIFTTLLVVFLVAGFANPASIKSNKIEKEKFPWDLVEALSANSDTRGFNGTWLTDDEFYYTARDKSMHKYNVATRADTIIVGPEILAIYGTSSSFKLSPDNKKILVRYDAESVFRHSSIAKYDVYDLQTNGIIKIHNGKKLSYCGWSTLNDRLAYVYENNVYIHFEDGSEIQLTHDGVIGEVYNGIPDWVYEEEVLSTDSALWWSPDGLKLAMGTFNDTNVKTFQYAIYGEAEDPKYQYPREEHLKYPKSGTPNPIVGLRVFDFTNTSKLNRSIELKAPTAIVTDDHILQNVKWIDSKNILVTWLNRRQNVASMQSCTLAGVCRSVKLFEEPEGWIKLSKPFCLKNGKNCIFSYWIGDWYQIWNLDLNTGTNLWKSRGNFTVTDLYGYDEENDRVYYQATLEGKPYVSHVYRNDECLTCKLRFDEPEYCLNAAASFSKNFSYYAALCLGPSPRYTEIFETQKNRMVNTWELNLPFRQKINTKQLPTEEFYNVTLADGSVGSLRLKLPYKFDARKKYPMIVNPYGGPDSIRVAVSFGVGFDAYLTTTHDFIIATIDGRGTGNKGKKQLFSINNNLGTHEVEDQIFITKFLQNLPYVDRDRVGIWGWSFGGYLTAKTISNDTEGVFQCGIAVAPVTSWLLYDSIYTERFMGLPTASDNLHNYEESSVFKRLDNYKTHDFLLIHGSADDNVHYQQSLLLAKELEKNDILFDQMTYVDENHSIGSFSAHLYHTMEHFWIKCLGADSEEEDDK